MVAEKFSNRGLGWWMSEEGMIPQIAVYNLFGDAALFAPKTVFVPLHSMVCEVAHRVVDEYAADGQASACHSAGQGKPKPTLPGPVSKS